MNWDLSVSWTRTTRAQTQKLKKKKKNHRLATDPQQTPKKIRILYASLIQIWTDRPPDHYQLAMGLKRETKMMS